MARRGKKKTAVASQSADRQQQPKIVEKVTESDDEEIPEDEAFNSEDERMFGHFFDNDNESEQEDEVTSDDDDDDEEEDDSDGPKDDDDDDGGQYMLDLLNKLDGGGKKEDGLAQMANVSESEYSSSISRMGLTMDNLMQGLQDTAGFRDLQKTLQKQEVTTPAPLDKVKTDRTQRKMTYEDQVKEITRWTRAIQENRKAETLDFKPTDRMVLTKDELVDKFVPNNDFEKELEEALKKAGQQDEEEVLKAEEKALQDDLGANRLTMEEYKRRRGQLAQIRALMFYHEQKRHHIKKIKSKKYRRIRKKQRERLKETAMEAAIQDDEELAQELKEKEEVSRIQERMTLAHKNTSKWAKRILKRGKNVDIDTRRALSAQLKRGDDLRKKMMGEEHSDDDSDEDLVESARKILAETEDSSDPTQGKTGLFKLSFMQKGIQKQREKAKEEARRLLNELEGNEMEDYDDESSENEGHKADKSERKEKVADEKEMKGVLKKGELVATPLGFGNSNTLATSGGIDIAIDNGSENDDEEDLVGGRVEAARPVEHIFTSNSTDMSGEQHGTVPASANALGSKQSASRAEDKEDGDYNPWLETKDENGGDKGVVNSKKRKPRGIVDVEEAVNILDAGKATTGPNHDTKNSDSSPTSALYEGASEKKLTMLSQEELIKRAFAAPDEKDVDEEFQKEKEAMIEDNETSRKKQKEGGPAQVAGWGSWVGAGAPPPRPRKLTKKLRAPAKKEGATRKRKDESKPNVIINQKRMKKVANTFMLGEVPHPYSSRAEYEEAMLGGVGKEWNVTNSFKSMTRPEILTRSGKVIQPISRKVKAARAPAKF